MIFCVIVRGIRSSRCDQNQEILFHDLRLSLHHEQNQEALSDARGEGEDAPLSDEQVADICAVFAQREETLRDMMKLYERMYNNLQQEKREQEFWNG